MLGRWCRLLVASAVLVAGGVVAVERLQEGGAGGRSSVADRAVLATVAPRVPHWCHGVSQRQVQGLDPTYTRKRLAAFPNDGAVCRAVWTPRPRRWFVPQGIAVSGRTAWISGYRYREAFGERPCQLMRIDLRTGRRLAFHPVVEGRVGGRPVGYCRHGGGIAQEGRWLWVAEKNRLWLLRADQRHRAARATRVWRIHAPARGSAVVLTGASVGLVPYQKTGKPRIYWFSRTALLRRRVLDLAPDGHGEHVLRPVSSTRVPRYVQGAAVDARGRLFLARSGLACGELVTPRGHRVAFVPGAEGIDFAAGGTRLWAVSESGAWPYAHSRKPLTPLATAFETPRLFHLARARCGYSAW